MTIRDLFFAAVLLGSIIYLAFVAGEALGEKTGRDRGYRMCLGEQDDDRARYARGDRPREWR